MCSGMSIGAAKLNDQIRYSRNRERVALRARYGLDDHPPLKFRKIVRQMRLTKNVVGGLVRQSRRGELE
jgi:hypothetical protein